jgi:hypothetical protein
MCTVGFISQGIDREWRPLIHVSRKPTPDSAQEGTSCVDGFTVCRILASMVRSPLAEVKPGDVAALCNGHDLVSSSNTSHPLECHHKTTPRVARSFN